MHCKARHFADLQYLYRPFFVAQPETGESEESEVHGPPFQALSGKFQIPRSVHLTDVIGSRDHGQKPELKFAYWGKRALHISPSLLRFLYYQ